jgi:hypothetical protein
MNEVTRAMAAFYRFRESEIITRGEIKEYQDHQYVVLYSDTQVVAVYRIMNSGQLKRLRRYPKGVI